ncbi:tRNA (adenine(22)-N(1))-methyltransferase [Macrococcoides caseolyticum]|uniref:tRNA (adenine(22)-N(1))-methyltransferase n=1 Tax=Macrococcoides caseolyticum TaxID=69966 RepID=UPI001F3FA044|nr:tRNA (adenine(22)-N(1))-methyltransferase TrmK [Macrococcus caseolyticus]MCE4956137.1 tRNA (adenine(22)-N(1))-methyltransferase TrmK [Macrococcus caseolyticus]
MIPINNRLKRVAKYIQHDKLADIGSDHAYLPLYVLERGIIKHAIAGEVVKGPYDAALQNVAKYNAQHAIEVRLGNGLDVIQEHEVDVITICGMGGPLIAEILQNGQEKLKTFPRLILQSNIHSEAVRKRLVSLGYEIIAEEIFKEKKHTYEIIVAEKAVKVITYSAIEYKFGPLLLKEKNDVFKEKWQREYQHLLKVQQTIQHDAQHAQKYQSITNEINLLNEVLNNEN